MYSANSTLYRITVDVSRSGKHSTVNSLDITASTAATSFSHSGTDDFVVVHATSRTPIQSQTRPYGSSTYRTDESTDAFDINNGYSNNDEGDGDGDGDGDSEWGGSRAMRQRSAILRNNYNQVSMLLLSSSCIF